MINKEENKVFLKKMSELFFEKFKVPSFCIAPQEITSVICNGSFNGLSVDLGHSIFEIAPVIKSEESKIPTAIPEKLKALDCAGEDLIAYNSKYLADNNIKLPPKIRNLVGKNMLEKVMV